MSVDHRRFKTTSLLLLLLSCHLFPAVSLTTITATKAAFRRSSIMASHSTEDISDVKGSLLISEMDKLGLHDDGNDSVGLVLASQSPRRREILDMMGLSGKYRAQPSPLDETALQLELAKIKDLTPIQYTKRLAEAKAEASAKQDALGGAITQKRTLYLGSDTIVELNGKILEKPKDADDATRMLQELSGNSHRVHTGVALFELLVLPPGDHDNTNTDDDQHPVKLLASFVETAEVTFASLTDRDIHAYVKSGEPMDKAGAYGIQGIGGQLVCGLKGDFFTVMGLPMHLVSRALVKALEQ